MLVCIAVPLKHTFGVPQATAIMGPIHGVAFVPFGAFFNVGWLKRREAAL